jgi:hypothetical protein
MSSYNPDYTKWMREVYRQLIENGIENRQAMKLAQDQEDLFEDNFSSTVVAEIVVGNLSEGIAIGQSHM